MKLPAIGLGTWMLKGEKCTEVVRTALDLGYRHIDTAFAYENHKDIARALKGVAREDIFITSKIWLGQPNALIDVRRIEESVAAACDRALQELGLDYLDLMLIHWPIRSLPLDEAGPFARSCLLSGYRERADWQGRGQGPLIDRAVR